MGDVIPFRPRRADPRTWTPTELAALDRLIARMPGAVAWELESDERRAYILGAEEETLLMVSRSPTGIAVASGWNPVPHWHGPSLERYR